MENDIALLVSTLEANSGEMTFQALKDALAFSRQGQLTFALRGAKSQSLVTEHVTFNPETRATTHTIRKV